MARATAQETADRVELLAGMILAGSNNTECLVYARQTWGVSRAQGYKLVKRAWAQIKNDVDATGIDRQELLSWAIQTLITAGGQALKLAGISTAGFMLTSWRLCGHQRRR